MRKFISDGGSGDPKMNRDLDRAFREGKTYNVPMSFMLETVKKLVGFKLLYKAKHKFYWVEMFSVHTDMYTHTYVHTYTHTVRSEHVNAPYHLQYMPDFSERRQRKGLRYYC